MPFAMAGFNTVSAGKSGAAPSVFSYRTQDAPAVVDTTGYFNEVRDLLQVGDFIMRASVDAGGNLVTAGLHVVRLKTASTVDVTDTLALTVTNTD